MNKADYVSLLWKNHDETSFFMDDKSIEDLDISTITQAHESLMELGLIDVLRKVPIKEETVVYRQAILRDFIDNTGLLQNFVELAKKVYELKNMIKFAFEREYTLYNVLKRLEESESIVKALKSLHEELKLHSIQSEGLIAYKKMLEELLHSDLFEAYISDLRTIRSMKKVSGIKIGLNLNRDLSPKEAIVLSLEEEPFKYTRSMKKKLAVLLVMVYQNSKKIPRRIFAPETTIPKEDLNELEKNH